MFIDTSPIGFDPHNATVNHLCLILLRYASLYFCLGVESQENELLALEIIHRYVELLDKYFGNVFHLLIFVMQL